MKSFTPILLILISIGIFFFFIDPQYQKIKTLQAQIDENNKTLEISKKLTAQREQLSDKFKKISRSEADELEKLLPDTVDNVRLIIDIRSIAKQAGIMLRDIDIKSEEDKPLEGTIIEEDIVDNSVLQEERIINYVDSNKIGVISFSFSASAQYETFLDFLKQLEQSRRIVDIRSIEISRGSDATDGAIFFDYKVVFDTYWLK